MEATNNIQTMPSPTKPNQSLPKMAVERLAGGASVSRAFGEPIAVQGRTIIPVAMVAMGFRGGFWGRVQGLFGNSAAEPHPANGATNGASNAAGEEQARGGMMRRMVVRPVGFIDVTNGDSRFVTIAPGRFVAQASRWPLSRGAHGSAAQDAAQGLTAGFSAIAMALGAGYASLL